MDANRTAFQEHFRDEPRGNVPHRWWPLCLVLAALALVQREVVAGVVGVFEAPTYAIVGEPVLLRLEFRDAAGGPVGQEVEFLLTTSVDSS